MVAPNPYAPYLWKEKALITGQTTQILSTPLVNTQTRRKINILFFLFHTNSSSQEIRTPNIPQPGMPLLTSCKDPSCHCGPINLKLRAPTTSSFEATAAAHEIILRLQHDLSRHAWPMLPLISKALFIYFSFEELCTIACVQQSVPIYNSI